MKLYVGKPEPITVGFRKGFQWPNGVRWHSARYQTFSRVRKLSRRHTYTLRSSRFCAAAMHSTMNERKWYLRQGLWMTKRVMAE